MTNPASTFFGWFTLSSVLDQNTVFSLSNQLGLRYDPTNTPPVFTWSIYDKTLNVAVAEVFETIEQGVPFMVCAYYDGTKMGLSVNGSEWVGGDAPQELWQEPGMVFEAVYNASNAGPVNCSKFRIYPRVLTNAEIAILYQEGA